MITQIIEAQVATQVAKRAAEALSQAIQANRLDPLALKRSILEKQSLAPAWLAALWDPDLATQARPYVRQIQAKLGPTFYDKILRYLFQQVPAHAVVYQHYRAWWYNECERMARAAMSRLTSAG